MSNLKNVVWLQCICSISKSVGSLFGLISFDFQIKPKENPLANMEHLIRKLIIYSGKVDQWHLWHGIEVVIYF